MELFILFDLFDVNSFLTKENRPELFQEIPITHTEKFKPIAENGIKL